MTPRRRRTVGLDLDSFARFLRRRHGPVGRPKTRAAPGGAASFRRRTHPGLPKRWSDPPPVDLRALACVSTFTSPVVPQGVRRAMPFSGQSTGEPALLPFGAPHRLPGGRCRPDHSGWRTNLRRRSRNPVCRLPGPVAPRRHVGFPTTVPPRPRRPANRSPLPESPRLPRPVARSPRPEPRPRSAGCPAPLASRRRSR